MSYCEDHLLNKLPPHNIEAEESLISSIEQDADLVAFIHRAEVFKKKGEAFAEEGKADLIVAKHRNGPIDKLQLAFLKAYTRFENLAHR